MNTLNIAAAGFAAVSAALLFVVYVFFINVPSKSAYSIVSCGVLLAALATIEVSQLIYFNGGPEPLGTWYYRLALFVAPFFFYFFGRWAIYPTEPFRPLMLIHLVPILLLFVVRLEIALPIMFLFGAGYSLWFGYVVYGLRGQRKQFRFEFFYFSVMSVIAVVVLLLGFSLPYIDHDWFYLFYNSSIAVAFAIMVVALIAYPDLIGDLTEAARVRYGATTLRGVDVEATLKKLHEHMTGKKAYQDEGLNLSTVAEHLGLTSHQLSELVNTHLKMGFSRYVRECRIEAAKQLLVSAPSQSILSISMDTGFRSQSAFYAAFKEVTGQSPGDYRKAHSKAPQFTASTPR